MTIIDRLLQALDEGSKKGGLVFNHTLLPVPGGPQLSAEECSQAAAAVRGLRAQRLTAVMDDAHQRYGGTFQNLARGPIDAAEGAP